MAHYNLIFQGKIADDASLDEVKQHFARLFKADEKKLAALFSGKKVIIKKNIDTESAKKYLAILKKSGAIIQAVKVPTAKQEKEVSTTTKASASDQEPQHSNPSSGSGLSSLINYNKSTTQDSATSASNRAISDQHTAPAEAAPIKQASSSSLQLAPSGSDILPIAKNPPIIETPDISHISMSEAQTGSLEEFAQKIEAIELPNIDNLSMSGANEGSLSEFSIKTEAAELPDISNLDITKQDETPLSSQSAKKHPIDIPDISRLSMSGAQEGSLEGIESKAKPIEIPDISHLSMEKHQTKKNNMGKASFQID